jgi:lysozyme
MTDRGYNLIKCFEGLCLHSYQDVGGVWTIGYGATRYEDGTPVGAGQTITKQRADDMFAYQIDGDYAQSVDEDVGIPSPNINQVQFEALVSFAYNIGTNGLHTSTLLSKVKANPNDPTIRDEFMKWVNVNGNPVQGLINRRKKEADYYFSVDNSVCTPVESCA